MRTAQNFNALQVEKGGVQALGTGHIDAVDIDADALVTGCLVGVEGHDAANADNEGRLAGFEGGDAQGRNGAVLEADQAAGVTVNHGGCGHDRDSDWGLLKVGLRLGRSDHDFFKGGARVGGGLCGHGRASQNGGETGPSCGRHQMFHCQPLFSRLLKFRA